jgi:predicted GIY-YIG superfamily endonuclease
MSDKPWYVYCLATFEEPIQTYIGATIDPDRRLQQHNGEQKGGARATARRPNQWYRVCYVKGFMDNHQALSFEWHWKHFSRKLNGSPLDRRDIGLQKTMEWAQTKKFPTLEIVS